VQMGHLCGRVVGTTRHAPMGRYEPPCAPPLSIDTIRQQLNDLLANIEIEREALAAEQAAVTRATEALHEAPSLQAAIREGQEIMRGRVVALIDAQREMLKRGGTNALVLGALRRQLMEVEA